MYVHTSIGANWFRLYSHSIFATLPYCTTKSVSDVCFGGSRLIALLSMFKKILAAVAALVVALGSTAQDLQTPFERSGGSQSATYEEIIAYYRSLDRRFSAIDIQQVGPSDVIYPLHVTYFSKDGRFDPREWKEKGKLVMLINNGIHPGEPDGIDASMMLLRDAAMGKIQVPEHIVLAVVPVFNIGGALNRGSHSRANQNGPRAYGFRGSAQNLDLNRDFIKLDAKETQSLVQFFHTLDPDIFIDNHVSNGADYQHVMTLLTVNPAKQGYHMGRYLENKFEPAIYRAMEQHGYPLVPYVNHWGHSPDKGWQQFYEPPRFASGFAALFRSFAFVPEAHMLKPFKQRVEATYTLMHTLIAYAAKHGAEIKSVREMEAAFVQEQQLFTIDYKVDTTRSTMVNFLGYEAAYRASDVSGKPRLFYDRGKPYTKQVPFYNHFVPGATATAPKAYVLPQGWHRVVDRLKLNGVLMRRLNRDSVVDVTVYRITGHETGNRPYEGHYLHRNVRYAASRERVQLYKGDFIIPTNQPSRRYLIETLEPNAPDAFFAWGFFDAVLQQKEHYSDYVFEETAAALLKNDSKLQQQLEERRSVDSAFAESGHAQLDFIYKSSPYYESVHNRYPVFRLE